MARACRVPGVPRGRRAAAAAAPCRDLRTLVAPGLPRPTLGPPLAHGHLLGLRPPAARGPDGRQRTRRPAARAGLPASLPGPLPGPSHERPLHLRRARHATAARRRLHGVVLVPASRAVALQRRDTEGPLGGAPLRPRP